MASILADAGCTLNVSPAPPYMPADLHKLRHQLQSRFSSDSSLRSQFLAGLSSYIDNQIIRRLLHPVKPPRPRGQERRRNLKPYRLR